MTNKHFVHLFSAFITIEIAYYGSQLDWVKSIMPFNKKYKHKLIWILNRHDYQFQVPKTYPLSYDAHFLPEKKIENQFFLVQVLSRGC